MGAKKKKFKVDLELNYPATSFVEVDAKDSSDAWMKAMNFIKGKTVKGVKGLGIEYKGKGRQMHVKRVKSVRDLDFDYPDPMGHSIRISHVTEHE
jgi:hypothetical protein